MSDHLYILKDGQPVIEPDVVRWGRWFERNTTARIVAKTTVGDAVVSTVFLGIDHGYRGGPPVLWETMIFGGQFNESQWRYRSAEAAKAHHDALVAALRGGAAGELPGPEGVTA